MTRLRSKIAPLPALAPPRRTTRLRLAAVLACVAAGFAAIGFQTVRLALSGDRGAGPRLAAAEPIARATLRPDIVDRRGRLIATDVMAPSLYADPALIVDVDDVVDQLAAVLPELDARALRPLLADKARRFVWIRRGLPPRVAQAVHDLGLPGLAFRHEPRRTYPAGLTAGHIVGHVGFDNQGVTGLERAIDEAAASETSAGTPGERRAPVRLTLDIGVQHGLEAELADAMQRLGAKAAAAVLLDANSGEVVAAASLPGIDPARPSDSLDPDRIDRLSAGVYELGSIFKAFTVAMALDAGQATLDTVYDVRQPLRVGRYLVRDLHPAGRPLTVREIFVTSSNVGAGMIALEAGADRQKAFLARLGLTTPLRTEAGIVTAPKLPKYWGKAETITIAYGHGMATAPLQLAAAAASLVNGGARVTPTFLSPGETRIPRSNPREDLPRHVISPSTSAAVRELMRRNVTSPKGTGRRAEVVGLEVGGKTGTAEIAGVGGYQEKAVISSFLAAFPMSAPKYVLLLMLHEPKGTTETGGEIVAGLTAAPAAGRLLQRLAPLLEVSAAN